MKVLVDTGPLVAMINRRDTNHRWATDQSKLLGPLFFTCEAVITEAHFLLGRTHDGRKQLNKMIADGGIGDVIRLEAGLSFFVDDPANIRLSKELAGGSLMDAGCYAVYAVRYAMSAEPTHAMAFDRKSNGIEVDTTMNGFLQFPNGGVAYVWSSVEGPRQRVLQAIGTKGTISIGDGFGETADVVVTRGDGEPEVMKMTARTGSRCNSTNFRSAS